jgi:hypothetical protein
MFLCISVVHHILDFNLILRPMDRRVALVEYEPNLKPTSY